MVVFLLVLVAFSCGLSCNAHKNRAKIVEDYVVSANFDENKNIPQLNTRHMEDSSNSLIKDISNIPISSRENQYEDDSDRILEERDLLVHHHHLPPPHPPVPPPPSPGLAYAPSLFAVGLITFLILLNSLQTSLLLILKQKNSVLGSVTGALGRKKRSAVPDLYKFGEKHHSLHG